MYNVADYCKNNEKKRCMEFALFLKQIKKVDI